MRILAVFIRASISLGSILILLASAWGNDSYTEFSIGKAGRPIVVPVQIGYSQVQCLVDTGASRTTFDTLLRGKLGPACGSETIATPGGMIRVPQFESPAANVGPYSLKSIKSVLCFDLTPLRMATGEEVYGVIGMDFLRHFIVEIDFDIGRISLATSETQVDPKTEASTLPLSWQHGCPVLAVELSMDLARDIRIDTGANVSTLQVATFRELAEQHRIEVCRSATGFTAAGRIESSTGFLSQIKIDEYVHQGMRVDSDRFHALGLSYLSRYRWRFDFPRDRCYFTPSSRFSEPEPVAASGISVAVIDYQKTIIGVSPQSPADLAGLQAGDVIQEIDGKGADSLEMFTIGQILTSTPGQSVELIVKRNGRQSRTTVVLGNRLNL